MAAIVWADVSGWFSEMSTASATVQTDALALANEYFDPTKWSGGEDGIRLRIARIHLAAHTAATSKTAGAAGSVASRSGGGYSESFGPVLTTEDLAVTSYGRELARMLYTVFGGPRVI